MEAAGTSRQPRVACPVIAGRRTEQQVVLMAVVGYSLTVQNRRPGSGFQNHLPGSFAGVLPPLATRVTTGLMPGAVPQAPSPWHRPRFHPRRRALVSTKQCLNKEETGTHCLQLGDSGDTPQTRLPAEHRSCKQASPRTWCALLSAQSLADRRL